MSRSITTNFWSPGFWSRSALTGLLATGGMVAGLSPVLAEDTTDEQRTFVVFVADDDSQAEVEVDVEEIIVDVPKLWLGVSLKDIEGDLAAYLGDERGILVDSVFPDSPAEKAGIQVGDVLLAAGGDDLSSPADLLKTIKSLKGEDVEPAALTVAVLRQGKNMDIEVTPAQRPADEEISAIVGDGDEQAFSFSFSGNESEEEVQEMVKKLRTGRLGKGMNVFRFGSPSMFWVPDDRQLDGNLNIKVIKEVNGDKVVITVTRTDDEPAKITVDKNGEVEEFQGDNLDEMPEEISALVRPMLLGKRSFRGFTYRPNKDGQSRFERRFHILGGDDEDIVLGDLMDEEMVEKYQAMAKEMAEKSKEMVEKHRLPSGNLADYARRARTAVRGVTANKEMEELRALIQELRAEVEELRSQLKQDDDDDDE